MTRSEQLHKIEDRLRKIVFKNRIRVREFFIDYDPLRSGLVTQLQFRRCLDVLKLILTDEEFGVLVDMYGDESKGPKMIDYMSFCDSIDTGMDSITFYPQVSSIHRHLYIFTYTHWRPTPYSLVPNHFTLKQPSP